jgi:hypothetical protein
MANLPATKQIDLLAYEIYHELSYQEDTLIWLSPEEEQPTLNQRAEFLKNLSVDTQDICGLQPIALDCPPGQPLHILPAPEPHCCSNTDIRLHLPNTSEGEGSLRISITSSSLTYKSLAQFNATRWLFRVAALVSILLIGSVLPSILEHMRPMPVRASAAVGGPSTATQSAGRPRSRAVRVLTIMAGRDETVKEISLRYVGHFDDDLFEEICKLNPELKDPDHLEDGQLIRIPLRSGTSVN